MQTIEREEQNSIVAKEDFALVKSYLERIGAPFYDSEKQEHVNGTPIIDVTNLIAGYVGDTSKLGGNRFYLKQDYKNPLTDSVKGRAVASMVLKAIRAREIYTQTGSRKQWIEPTSGNTGMGLAEIAKMLGVKFTAVFSRLDVPEKIRENLLEAGATILAIGSEYSLGDLEAIARKRGKSVVYYWSTLGGPQEQTRSVFSDKVKKERGIVGQQSVEVKQIDDGLLFDFLMPLAVEASKTPIIARAEKGEFDKLKKDLKNLIPELVDPDYIVVFLCPQGNSSMLISTVLSQLGFANVCSIQGGTQAILSERGMVSSEFCPLPGSSIARSSIEFVKKLVQDNPEEYFTFMQYEN
ncbi:MAG: pyridoxal-phosphate dependent enzyme, partial [Rhabdochlamydiaceae bacterium]